MSTLLLSLILFSSAPPGPPRFEISAPACRTDWYDSEELEDLLSAETSSATLKRLSFAVPACESEPTTLEIQVERHDSPVLMSRLVELSDVEASARLRTLVLVVSELLSASLAPAPVDEPEESERHAVERIESATRTETPVERPPPASKPWRGLTVGFIFRVLPDHGSILWGGRAEAAVSIAAPLALSVDGGFELGRAVSPMGDVQIGIASIGSSLLVVAESSSETLRFAAGPRLEVGFASATGTPVGEEVLERGGSAPVFIAGARGALQLKLSGDWWLSTQLDLGGVVLGLEALSDDETVMSVTGLSTMVSVGLAGSL